MLLFLSIFWLYSRSHVEVIFLQALSEGLALLTEGTSQVRSGGTTRISILYL
jgi:hypothetical protein